MVNEILLQVYPNHCFASHGQSLLWSKSRLPNKAQPVPPIYQLEVAAPSIMSRTIAGASSTSACLL
jgi:hypothetical protein